MHGCETRADARDLSTLPSFAAGLAAECDSTAPVVAPEPSGLRPNGSLATLSIGLVHLKLERPLAKVKGPFACLKHVFPVNSLGSRVYFWRDLHGPFLHFSFD